MVLSHCYDLFYSYNIISYITNDIADFEDGLELEANSSNHISTELVPGISAKHSCSHKIINHNLVYGTIVVLLFKLYLMVFMFTCWVVMDNQLAVIQNGTEEFSDKSDSSG